jgi:hypothetical protein
MDADTLQRYRHAEPPFAIDLPADVEIDSAAPGTLLVARDPGGEGRSPFRANLTVVAEQLPDGFDPADYTAAGLAQAERSIPGWRLIDRTDTTLSGRPGERTLATYLVTPETGIDLGRAVSVTLEQWRVIEGDVAWIVSCSCDTAEYWQASETWTRCAESLRLGSDA